MEVVHARIRNYVEYRLFLFLVVITGLVLQSAGVSLQDPDSSILFQLSPRAVVTSCEELQLALGENVPNNVIQVQSNLLCPSQVWSVPVLVVQDTVIVGSKDSDATSAIDWADSSRVVVVASNVTLTFQNIMLMQDFLGLGGLNLAFLSVQEEAKALLRGVAVGVRSCSQPIGQFDQVLNELPRPPGVPGIQEAFSAGDSGLLVADVAFSPTSSNSTWRLCGSLFRCGATSALEESFVKDFRHDQVTDFCKTTSPDVRVGSLLGEPEQDRAAEQDTESNQQNTDSDTDSVGEVLVLVALTAFGTLVIVGVSGLIFYKVWKRSNQRNEKQTQDSTSKKKPAEEIREYEISKKQKRNAENPEGHAATALEFGTKNSVQMGALSGIELQHIELGERLDEGEAGMVYKGYYMGIPVAVKVIDHDGQCLLEETGEPLEALLSKHIFHSSIVQMYLYKTHRFEDIKPGKNSLFNISTRDTRLTITGGSDGDGHNTRGSIGQVDFGSVYRTFIVMEFCNGGSLTKAIQKGTFCRQKGLGAPDLELILLTALDIARALSYLHAIQIVHGDLNPENILLKSESSDQRGYVCKVGDFGLSRFIHEKSHIQTSIFGTPSYMPPELLTDGILTTSTDVYSFGIILWQLMAGQAPFKGMTDEEIAESVCQGHRPQHSDSSPGAYSQLVDDCWQENRHKRPTFPTIVQRLKELNSRRSSVDVQIECPHGTLQSQSLTPLPGRSVDDVKIIMEGFEANALHSPPSTSLDNPPWESDGQLSSASPKGKSVLESTAPAIKDISEGSRMGSSPEPEQTVKILIQDPVSKCDNNVSCGLPSVEYNDPGHTE